LRFIIYTALALSLISMLACDTRTNILDKFMDQSPKELFKIYHYLFEKTYSLNTEEGVARYRNFKQTLEYIKSRNAENLSFELGLNQFSDLTKEEYRARLIPKSAFKAQKRQLERFLVDGGYIDFDNYDDEEVAPQQANFTANWTTSLVGVKDQAQCGSCWAFSAAGALEGNYNIKNKPKTLISFSEQQIVSCAKNAGDGCDGGNSNAAFTYTAANGIELESDYPYTSSKGVTGTCLYNKAKALYKNTGYNYCTNDKTVGEKIKVCTLAAYQGFLSLGPFSVYMAADSNDFQNYKGGVLVFKTSDCKESDHAVLAVGWGVDTKTGLTYVLVRNSWGTSWGEKGYFRVKYDPANKDTCYITGTVFQPTF